MAARSTFSLYSLNGHTLLDDAKKQLLELLHLIASETRQLEYEARVPTVDITAELVCLWFDDMYDAYKDRFSEHFSDSEVAAIRKFHDYFERHVAELPPSLGTIFTWHNCDVWRGIMNNAKSTIQQIAV